MPSPIPALVVSAYTACSALGRGVQDHAVALREQRSGLLRNDLPLWPLDCWIGRVDGLEHAPWPADWHAWDCRNNRLAWLALQQDDFLAQVAAARQRYGAARIALLLGTSTASVEATEAVYRQLDTDGRVPPDEARRRQIHTPHSLGAFVAHALELRGPLLTISTACSSSAKVFASAERMIRLGLVDAAVVGGVDSLCGNTLYGFNALELIAAEPCRPFGLDRRGISIGEAGGFALLERERPGLPRLIGYGESSDAYHMSSPHPEGVGAERALDDALARAGIDTAQIDYINLHGTGSQKNDEVEAALVARRFQQTSFAASTKAYTGHTLGAAGMLEAVLSLLALQHGWIPANLAGTADPACGDALNAQGRTATLRIALSHSFGFGGNNACLLFAGAAA